MLTKKSNMEKYSSSLSPVSEQGCALPFAKPRKNSPSHQNDAISIPYRFHVCHCISLGSTLSTFFCPALRLVGDSSVSAPGCWVRGCVVLLPSLLGGLSLLVGTIQCTVRRKCINAPTSTVRSNLRTGNFTTSPQ